jgi:hypothetical protein
MKLSETKLTPRKFKDVSSIEYSLFTCPLITWPDKNVLVAEFRGECRDNGDADFMTGIIKAANEVWFVSALILDWRKLKYEWGNEIAQPMGALGIHRVNNKNISAPTAIIVSDLNSSGLTSLVNQEMDGKPEELLFNSLEEALAAVDKQAHEIFTAP